MAENACSVVTVETGRVNRNTTQKKKEKKNVHQINLSGFTM
jgi:hypothetical protein